MNITFNGTDIEVLKSLDLVCGSDDNWKTITINVWAEMANEEEGDYIGEFTRTYNSLEEADKDAEKHVKKWLKDGFIDFTEYDYIEIY